MPRTRKQKVVRGCLGALLLVAIAFFVVTRGYFFRKHYDVVSIKAAPEYQDGALLGRAWGQPVAARYQQAQVLFQPNGSLCGPTSLADVWRSLDRPDATPDRVLEGAGVCRLGFCMGGLNLDELASLARARLGRKVSVLRDLAEADFREQLAHVSDPGRRYVANFDRGPLFGTSGGHFSPLAAYMKDEDLVLVVDVNEAYRPWLVKAHRLYEAMDTVDADSGKKRGLLLIE